MCLTLLLRIKASNQQHYSNTLQPRKVQEFPKGTRLPKQKVNAFKRQSEACKNGQNDQGRLHASTNSRFSWPILKKGKAHSFSPLLVGAAARGEFSKGALHATPHRVEICSGVLRTDSTTWKKRPQITFLINPFTTDSSECLKAPLVADETAFQWFKFLSLTDLNVFWVKERGMGIKNRFQTVLFIRFTCLRGYRFLSSTPFYWQLHVMMSDSAPDVNLCIYLCRKLARGVAEEGKKRSKSDKSPNWNVCETIVSSTNESTGNMLKHFSMQNGLKFQERHECVHVSGTASQLSGTVVVLVNGNSCHYVPAIHFGSCWNSLTRAGICSMRTHISF